MSASIPCAIRQTIRRTCIAKTSIAGRSRYVGSPDQHVRSFTASRRRREEQNSKPAAADSVAPPSKPVAEKKAPEEIYFDDTFYSNLPSAIKSHYFNSTSAERKDLEGYYKKIEEELGPESEHGQEIDIVAQSLQEEVAEDFKDEMPGPIKFPKTYEDFSTMSELETVAPDEEYKNDDISSHAHGELDMHREIREYYRLAAWEMPLLSNITRPFEPPTSATPLRWRYTTYLGTPHPAANKVVLTFSPSRLPGLTSTQRAKLIKLAGPRYDPYADEVKMSCETYPEQAQNKRFLGDTLARLLNESRDKADDMQDVPFDFRHAKRKVRHRFPKEWQMNEQRRKEIDAFRAQGVVAGPEGVAARGIEQAKELEDTRVRESERVRPVGEVSDPRQGATDALSEAGIGVRVGESQVPPGS